MHLISPNSLKILKYFLMIWITINIRVKNLNKVNDYIPNNINIDINSSLACLGIFIYYLDIYSKKTRNVPIFHT